MKDPCRKRAVKISYDVTDNQFLTTCGRKVVTHQSKSLSKRRSIHNYETLKCLYTSNVSLTYSGATSFPTTPSPPRTPPSSPTNALPKEPAPLGAPFEPRACGRALPSCLSGGKPMGNFAYPRGAVYSPAQRVRA